MSCPAAFPFSAGLRPRVSGISPAHAETEADVDRKPVASDLLTRRLQYDLPGMDAVKVRRDVAYTTPADAELTMDVYFPPGRTASDRTPAVILVPGFPGAVKRIGSFVSSAELMAASGLVAITWATRNRRGSWRPCSATFASTPRHWESTPTGWASGHVPDMFPTHCRCWRARNGAT